MRHDWVYLFSRSFGGGLLCPWLCPDFLPIFLSKCSALFGGTSTALLSHAFSTIGQLSSWKKLFLDLRNDSMRTSFFITIKNFYDRPLAVARQLLNIGVVLLSPYYGYTTAIVAMAAISCLLGPVQFFVSARPFHKEFN
jgi:hypothetical protein